MKISSWPGPPPGDIRQQWCGRVEVAGGTLPFNVADDLLPWMPGTFVPDGLLFDVTQNLGHMNGARLVELDILEAGFHVMVGLTDDAYNFGDIAQRIDLARARAHHDLYYLPWLAQGHGRGSAMIRRAVMLWDALGIREVRTRAAEVGKYVWAMCGFDFASTGDRELLHAGVVKLAEQLGVPFEIPKLDHPWEYAAIGTDPLEMEDGEETEYRGTAVSSDDIAMATSEAAPKHADWFPLGKALLLFAPVSFWDGRFDLAPDSPSRQQMELYCP